MCHGKALFHFESFKPGIRTIRLDLSTQRRRYNKLSSIRAVRACNFAFYPPPAMSNEAMSRKIPRIKRHLFLRFLPLPRLSSHNCLRHNRKNWSSMMLCLLSTTDETNTNTPHLCLFQLCSPVMDGVTLGGRQPELSPKETADACNNLPQ